MLRLHALDRARAAAALLALLACIGLVSRAGAQSVPYVPTPQAVVDRMLEMAKVGRHDYLIDLGSGDGRIVVTAARRYGARGFGVDLDPARIAEAEENARKAGVTDKVAFYRRDLFDTDLSQATVVTMYLLPSVNMQLRPKLLALKPGTRIVSHDFSLEDWKADEHVQIPSPGKYGGSGGVSDIYLWIVPAQVAGAWRWELPVRGGTVTYVLDAKQRFQAFTGTVRVGTQRVPLQSSRIAGDRVELAFTANVHGAPVQHHISGRIDDAGVLVGTAQLSGPTLQAAMDFEARRPAGQ